MPSEEKKLDISEIRIRLDQFTERIVSGLKNRSRFALNDKIFSEEFAEGKTWFLYRLKKEQDLDSEFGRYLYFDQHPIIFGKEELSKPKNKRHPIDSAIKPIKIDVSKEIIEAYREVLSKICPKTDSPDQYGATTKMDVENILMLNERILGLGEQVAAFKVQQNPALSKMKNDDEIRPYLVILTREKEVIDGARELAKKYNIQNPDAIADFMQKVINITTEAEIKYIKSIGKN